MTRLTRRATLLVTFCLLASAATAYAECAWVLWEEASHQGVTNVSGWLLRDAHESQPECLKKQSAEIAFRLSAQGAQYGVRKLFGNTVVVTWPDGHTSNWRFLCLPDTVDPRGPKEK
jgi:hypothetical protein